MFINRQKIHHTELVSISNKLSVKRVQDVVKRRKHSLLPTIYRSLAFTLSEVLITLGIIGIVASLTIPTMMANYQKLQYVVGLKKFYTNTTQALIKLSTDYGSLGDLEGTGLFTGTVTAQTKGDIISSYFNVVKNCGTTGTDCFAPKYFSHYDASSSGLVNFNFNYGSDYKFITADGMSVLIEAGTYCMNYNTTGGYPGCSRIAVDVNGLKPPNTLGRDTFLFIIDKRATLYPNQGKGTYYMWHVDGATMTSSLLDWKSTGYCTSANTTAYGCAARIIEEGWQMNY